MNALDIHLEEHEGLVGRAARNPSVVMDPEWMSRTLGSLAGIQLAATNIQEVTPPLNTHFGGPIFKYSCPDGSSVLACRIE